MVDVEAFSIYLPSAARALPTVLFCLLTKMTCLFLSSLSSVSRKAQGCPQVCLSTQTLLFTEANGFSPQYAWPISGRLCVTWAPRVMPLLSASSLNQAQPDCVNQELSCFQVLCIFSFLISKNYFSCFSRFQKEEWGQMPWLCHPTEDLDVAKEWYWIYFF